MCNQLTKKEIQKEMAFNSMKDLVSQGKFKVEVEKGVNYYMKVDE